jgi:hypothetical protein
MDGLMPDADRADKEGMVSYTDDVVTEVHRFKSHVRVPWWLRLKLRWTMRRMTPRQRRIAQLMSARIDSVFLYGESEHAPGDMIMYGAEPRNLGKIGTETCARDEAIEYAHDEDEDDRDNS